MELGDMAGEATVAAPLSQQIVLEAISAAVGLDHVARANAEAALSSWEKDAAPGFIASLVQIVQQTEAAPQPARMLAAIVAKNAVGSSWRKTMGTKEWSRVPEDEKLFIRSAVEGMLLSEPSEQIALQLTLLIANMAQFDFPSGWPHLLSALVGAATWEQQTVSPAVKIRAMRAVKHVVVVLAAKRPSINTVEQAAAGPRLQTLVSERVEELKRMRAAAVASFGAVRQQWMLHSDVLTQAVTGGAAEDESVLQQREKLAKQCLRVIAAFIKMLPSLPAASEEIEPLYQTILQQVPVLLGRYPSVFVRMSECALAGLDDHPLEFRSYLPHFLGMFTTVMMELPLDREALQRQPKTLMVVTRFLARAMLNSSYNPQKMARLQPRSEWEPKTRMAAEADATVTAFFSEERCAAIVHAIVNKYLPLTPAELEEWEDSPEQAAMNDTVGLLESVEVGDAQSPRPCGHALFLCMAVKQPRVVSSAVLAYARELQQQTPVTTETWVLRDACYHAIGCCANKLDGSVDFNSWYASELRMHLDAPAEGTELLQRVLQARSLWLISQFSSGATSKTLTDETKQHALESVLRFMRAPDLKLALTAARVFYVLIVGGPNGIGGGIMGTEQLGDAANAEFTGHALGACFHLIQQLSEVENIVVVLRLLALFVVHSGELIVPHFDALAAALPQAWQMVESQVVGAAETRAHAVMLNVVASLLRRLKMAVLNHPALSQVVLQLIRFATDPAMLSQGREDLLDDGLTLWYSSLRSYEDVGPELLDLVSRLPTVLAANREPCKGLLLLEGYVLLGGEQFMQTHGAAACGAVGQFLVAGQGRTPKELLLAASVCDNFLQMHPTFAAPLLRDALAAMLSGVATGTATGLVAKTYIAALCRLVMVDASALAALCNGDMGAGGLADTFLDKMLDAHKVIERGWAGYGETRRELKLVALAICALLAAGYPLAWGKLSDRQTASGELAQGALKTIVSASLLESSPGRAPPRPDVEQVKQKEGRLAATQTELALRDPASPDYATPVMETLSGAAAHAIAQHGVDSFAPYLAGLSAEERSHLGQ